MEQSCRMVPYIMNRLYEKAGGGNCGWFKSSFANACKCVSGRFVSYCRKKVGLKDPLYVTRDLVLDFLDNVCVANYAKTMQQREKKRITTAIKVLNTAFDFDIAVEETKLYRGFDVMCPYCNVKTNYVDSKVVYGKTCGGKRYLCPICGAHVGTHKGTAVPLGTPANEELQKLRKLAHARFDKLWRERIMTRTEAYRWIAKEMNIPEAEAHIGMFDRHQCLVMIQTVSSFFYRMAESTMKSA